MFYESLKHHESTLAKRENSLKLREQSVSQREESINQKEEEFKQREEELKRREVEMVRREKELENRMLSAGEFMSAKKELVRSLSDEVRELELGQQSVENELDGDVEMREERESELYGRSATLNRTNARDFGDFAGSEPIQMNLKGENGLYKTRFSENFAYLRSRSEHLPSSSSKVNIYDEQPLSQPNYSTSHATPSSIHPAPSPSQKFKSLSKFYQHRTKSANNCSDEESTSSTPISKSRSGSNSTSNSNSPTSSKF
ncbi:hypothetical protein BKA69DRAFT_62228 [Paraphysoderma sedebokerense]|nr:hypothetical protein BKA69DRAFT_62228 [Paraphysoderma sedebokerense]